MFTRGKRIQMVKRQQRRGVAERERRAAQDRQTEQIVVLLEIIVAQLFEEHRQSQARSIRKIKHYSEKFDRNPLGINEQEA